MRFIFFLQLTLKKVFGWAFMSYNEKLCLFHTNELQPLLTKLYVLRMQLFLRNLF